jgi:hypothetical protein
MVKRSRDSDRPRIQSLIPGKGKHFSVLDNVYTALAAFAPS